MYNNLAVSERARVDLVASLKGAVIVSCQAGPESPLNQPLTIAALAQSAAVGGAHGFRVDGPANVAAVRAVSGLPIFGINKVDREGYDVRITSTLGDAVEVVEAGANLLAPTFSPDSRWIAYSTTGTGGGLYVQPFPGPGPRRQIAPSVGRVIWRRDGREILYLVEGTLMSIPVDWSANPSFGWIVMRSVLRWTSGEPIGRNSHTGGRRNLTSISVRRCRMRLPARRKNGTPCHRHESISNWKAA